MVFGWLVFDGLLCFVFLVGVLGWFWGGFLGFVFLICGVGFVLFVVTEFLFVFLLVL